jgi:UPF0755 protein
VSRGVKGAIALLVLALLAGGVFAFLSGELGSIGAAEIEEGRVITVDVEPGMGASAVADMLAEQGVIRSAASFRITARLNPDLAGRIQTGSYELIAGTDNEEILEILAEGPPPPEVFRVTIPEGLTVEQTLERFAESGPHDVEALRAALAGVPLPEWVPPDLPEGAQPFEGLLFPNTYDFRMDSDAQAVLARLVEETERVLEQVTPPPDLTAYQTLIMASLVEREARIRDEQPTISSVMHNRLASGMRLEIDATVLYALGEHRERVLYEDLEVDSPWNTYRNDGLPPTPISGAGEEAIRAAAEPAATDYLFYVVTNPETGEHGFSRTFEEHQQKIREARRG